MFSMVSYLVVEQVALDSDSVLMGQNIQWKGRQNIFARSDSDSSFTPEQSSVFYVNTDNGFWLNTNNPQVKFDIGKAGWLKLINASPTTCNSKYQGLLVYRAKGADLPFVVVMEQLGFHLLLMSMINLFVMDFRK